MTTTNKPGSGFWIIAVIALLWNLIGIFFWASENFLMTDEIKATLPAEQVEMMNNAPSWGIWVYAIAVFGGTLASVLLLMRKKLAVPLFLISLIAILIQMGYWIFGMDSVGVLGPQSLIMPLIVITIAIFLYFYSKGAAKNGWLS
ncbi:hypothetical protein ACFQO1_06030 [Jejudonia soesokkakensis]|uniref:Sugar transporter n=1 Tax=Jejudonia soesokkakensis TaxID=1323432 RepID=A0ABW2MU88_9FLAO